MGGAAPARAARPGRPRVMIVDDSAVARAVIARAIEASGLFELAGAAPHAAAARRLLAHERVDAILLDVEMPGVDGLTALPGLVAAADGARVLIVSSACAEGAAVTVQALALGAADTLVKPGAEPSSHAQFADRLVDKLSRLLLEDEAAPQPAPAPHPYPAPVTAVAIPPAPGHAAFDLLAIGASTGGIHALGHLLRAIPASMTAPILITQHLPATFMPFFAVQVATLAGRPCEVAADRARLRPGTILVAPGDAHVRPSRLGDGGLYVRLSNEAVASGCLPSVDVMFEHAAQACGARALGVVLSGMGRDGVTGARALAEVGGYVVAQDKESSVVWGMPGQVAAAGLARAVLPPDAIGRLVADRWSERVRP